MFKRDAMKDRAAERTMPSLPLFGPDGARLDYRPSWLHVPRTTWTDRLGGHWGMVGQLDAIRKGGRK